ncbi:MAG: hypothetical protein ACE5GI_05320, partial [Candidatus Aminicenantales bacterium]
MSRIKTVFLLAIVSFFLASGFSFSQTLVFPGKEKKENKLWGNYFVSGSFGLSYLFKDIRGDQNLFLSQFNLKEGVNIPHLSIKAYRNPEKSGFFDVISLQAQGFGAEPYGRAAFSLEKRNLFTISGGYTERKYFADVASLANPLFQASSEEELVGSFHTWNTKEKSFDLSARLKAASWLDFNASWQKTRLEGDSTITLRLLNNEFPLNEPVNQTSNIVRLGTEVNIKNYLFYQASGVYQKFELDQTASSSPENLGIRGIPFESYAIYLTEQSRQTKVDIKTWALSQSLQIIPSSRWTIDADFTKSWTDGQTSGHESIEGRFIWPLYDLVSMATYNNNGQLKKDFDKANLTLTFQLLPQLGIRAGYNYYKYKIDNADDLNYSFTRIYYNKTISNSLSSSPLIVMKLNKFFMDAEFNLSRNWTASAGYAHSVNKLHLGAIQGEEEEHENYTYNLNSFFGALGLKITKKLSLKTRVETGSYDKAFARLVPLTVKTISFQGDVKLENGLSGSLFYKYQQLKNTKFFYSSSFNGYGLSLSFQLKDKPVGAYFQLSRNDLSSSLEIVRFVSMFTEIKDVS